MTKQYKTADIKLGYSCNDKCIHCVVEELRNIAQKNKNPDLKTNEYLKEIDKAIENKVTRIVLTGGEPTIRKDFVEIVDYIYKTNTQIYLQTNGRFLSNPDVIKKIIGKIDSYIIALHGPNQTIHELITQSENSFNQTIQGIKNIIKVNGNICGKTVISKINHKTLLETCKLYNKLGVKEIYLAYPHSSGNPNYLEKIAPTYSQIKQEIENCIDWAQINDINLKLESILPCHLSKEYPLKYFSDFTEFNSQKQIKMLNQNQKSWENYTKTEKKKDPTKCQKCFYNQFCNGIWHEYIKLYGFKEITPITQIKDKIILKF